MIGDLVLTDEIKKLNPHILNWDIITKKKIYEENDINYIYGTIITSEYISPQNLVSSLNSYVYADYDRHHRTVDELVILDKYKKISSIHLAFERINLKYKKEIFSYDIFIKYIIDGLTSGKLKMACEYKYHIPLLSDRGWFPSTDFGGVYNYTKEDDMKYIYLIVMANYNYHVSNRDPKYNNDESGYNYICGDYVKSYGYIEFCEDIMFKKNITAKHIMELYNKDPKYFDVVDDVTMLQYISEQVYFYRKMFGSQFVSINEFYVVLLSKLISKELFNNIKVHPNYSRFEKLRVSYRSYDITPSQHEYEYGVKFSIKSDNDTVTTKEYMKRLEKNDAPMLLKINEIIKNNDKTIEYELQQYNLKFKE